MAGKGVVDREEEDLGEEDLRCGEITFFNNMNSQLKGGQKPSLLSIKMSL